MARIGPIQVASIGKNPENRPERISSLDAMEREIASQIGNLPLFAEELRQHPRHKALDPSELVFTGSGDSYASSLFARYLSGGRAQAEDPYELLMHPWETENKVLLITSVSGRTRANVSLAKRVRRLAKKRMAVTANPASGLARECDEVIRLSYKSEATPTSGTASFTASLIALASQIRRLPSLEKLAGVEKRAKQWARHLKILPREGFVFTGSGIGYALAAYGSLKIHEVLGLQADHEHIEQLGHSRLFGLRKTDNIICLAVHGDSKTETLFRALSKNGFHPQLLRINAEDPVISALQAAFSFQHLALIQARRNGLRECAFISDRKRLRLSSKLIY